MRQQGGQTSDSRHSRILKAGAGGEILDSDFSGTGIMVRTGAGTFATRTITGSGVGLTIGLGDGVSGNPIIVVDSKLVTRTHILYVESPVDTDVFPVAFTHDAITFSQVWAQTDVTSSTVDFNIEYRALTTPNTAGTDILSADLTADDNGATTVSFASSGAVAANKWLTYVATGSGVSGSPTKLWMAFEYVLQ